MNDKAKVGRPCSICNHTQLEEINRLIGTKSFRAISRQLVGADFMRTSLRRHTQNCLRNDKFEGSNSNCSESFVFMSDNRSEKWWECSENEKEKQWWK